MSDHIGFALSHGCPSDNELILGGSEERRKFIDLVISQFDKQYLSTLIRYNKALEQRNALLRQECSEEMLYDIWEEQMDSTAAQIHNSRDRFLQLFIPVFRRFYNEISSQNESADLIYKSHLSEGALLPQLKANRHKDLILGYTSRGIHRDDMDMMLGEYPMKRIGSQGQCKTYLIALKLAQYDFLREQGDTTPILLLDDIFDKARCRARKTNREIGFVGSFRANIHYRHKPEIFGRNHTFHRVAIQHFLRRSGRS